MKKFIYLVLLMVVNAAVMAQDAVPADGPMTGMRSEGKIYVVMAVVLTILVGLFLYLIRLDRKITKLEKKNR